MKVLKINQHTGEVVSISDSRTLQECKNQCLNFSRHLCSETIFSAGLDITTQQNAAIGIYPPERCEAIKSYIAACRNEYLRCKALILAAASNDEADAVTFTVPPVPEGM